MDSGPNDSIGRKLKALRKQKGYSQAELAAKVGVSTRTLQDWEADLKTARPRNLEALSSALEVPAGWFHNSDRVFQEAVAEAVSDLEEIYQHLGETLERLRLLAPRHSKEQGLIREQSTDEPINNEDLLS